MVVDVIEKAMDGQYVLITTDEAGGTLIFRYAHRMMWL